MTEARIYICGQCSRGTLITIEIPAEEVPPLPGALRTIAPDPEKTTGWRTVCENCGAVYAVSYDYGTLDLGLISGKEVGDDFEIFA